MSLAIIGGSGLYSLDGLHAPRTRELDTPFGKPSSPILSGVLDGGSEIFFLARHGVHHQIPPHQINYRANIYALKTLGVRFVLSVSAVGSLREEIRPGDLIAPDQFIDRTKRRTDTFFEDGVVAHVAFGTPVCPVLSEALRLAVDPADRFHSSGTYLCIEGPAFSTRAESRSYQGCGGDVIGMTNLPEAKLAREAELSYATLALVTDYDSWREGLEVDAKEIVAVLNKNVSRAKQIIRRLAPCIKGLTQPDAIRYSLDSALMSKPEFLSAEIRERLQAVLERRLNGNE